MQSNPSIQSTHPSIQVIHPIPFYLSIMYLFIIYLYSDVLQNYELPPGKAPICFVYSCRLRVTAVPGSDTRSMCAVWSNECMDTHAPVKPLGMQRRRSLDLRRSQSAEESDSIITPCWKTGCCRSQMGESFVCWGVRRVSWGKKLFTVELGLLTNAAGS